MKYSIGILTTVTLFAALILSGCESSSNRSDDSEAIVIETDRDSEFATSEVEADLQIYRTENSNRFTEFDQTISEIKQQIENESDLETRERLETKLEGYEETEAELKREMDEYKASASDNWDEFKDSFTNRMNNLGDSLENFFSAPTTTTSIN